MATIHVFSTGIIQVVDKRTSGQFAASSIDTDVYNGFIQAVESSVPPSKVTPTLHSIAILENENIISAIFYPSPFIVAKGFLKQLIRLKIDLSRFDNLALSAFTAEVDRVLAE